MMDDDANVNKKIKDDKETPGVGNKPPGVDKAEELPWVDDVKETPGVDDETPGDETESNKVEVEEKSTERTSGGMNLRRQPQKEYNCKNYNDNVFNITDKTQGNGIILLQLNSDNFEITEDKFEMENICS